MPRSPLLSHLRSLSVQLHFGSLAGQAPAAALERARQARSLSRRSFVQAAGAGASALVLGELGWARGGQAPRIAIVGAGLAGLVAALELRRRGYVADLYEASARAGGRVFTDSTTFAASGQRVERGGELIDSGHKSLRKLVKKLGLALDDLPASEQPGTQPLGLFGGQRYSFEQAEDDFAALYPLLHQDLVHAGYPATYDSHSQKAAELDHMSIDEWIESRVPGGLAAPLGSLLSDAYDIEYGALSSDQSALNLIYLLGYGATPNNFAIFGSSDESFRIRGGNEGLTALLATLIASQLRTSHRLRAASTLSDGRTRLVLDAAGGTLEEDYDRVILSVPFAVLRRDVDLSGLALQPLKRQAIAELGMGTNAKLHVQFLERHWNALGCSGETYGDTGFQCTWEETRAQGGVEGILDNFLGSAGPSLAGLTPEDAAQRFLIQIEPLLPGLSARYSGRASIDYWPGSPNQRGSYSYWRVGQYTCFSGIERAIEGSVHFAGEHTSIDYQGYMEGAVESGERAAAEVLASL